MSTTTETSERFVHSPNKVVLHSSYTGSAYEDVPDLITGQLTGRRFILAELNTHRVLSKNSASSRAIPFPKQVQRIIDDLAYPEIWGSEKKGMQAGDEIDDIDTARALWEEASREAIKVAHDLAEMGVHKSIVNRLLEPFMWHTVVITGTAWNNFFAQRCSPLAQAEIRVMAEEFQTAVENSTPQELTEHQWHLPYVEVEDWMHLTNHLGRGVDSAIRQSEMVKISAARCARVSYLTQEGKRDVGADLALYDRLVEADPPHWSPLEHVATPWPENRQTFNGFEYDLWFCNLDGEDVPVPTQHLPRVGNLLGWRSLRTTVEAERQLVTYR